MEKYYTYGQWHDKMKSYFEKKRKIPSCLRVNIPRDDIYPKAGTYQRCIMARQKMQKTRPDKNIVAEVKVTTWMDQVNKW